MVFTGPAGCHSNSHDGASAVVEVEGVPRALMSVIVVEDVVFQLFIEPLMIAVLAIVIKC